MLVQILSFPTYSNPSLLSLFLPDRFFTSDKYTFTVYSKYLKGISCSLMLKTSTKLPRTSMSAYERTRNKEDLAYVLLIHVNLQ